MGDQLIVESLPFESTLNLDPPAPQDSAPPAGVKKPLLEQLKSDPKLMVGAAGILIVVLGGGFFAVRRLVKGSAGITPQVLAAQTLPQSGGETGAPQLPRASSGANEKDSWVPSVSGKPPLPALAPGKIEVLSMNLRESAQKDAEICAGVLRGWLREERA